MRLRNLLLGAVLVASPVAALAQTTTTPATTTPPAGAMSGAPAGTMSGAPAGTMSGAPAGTMSGPGMSHSSMSGSAMSGSGMSNTAAGSVAQYSSLSDAQAKCTGDTVVWANAKSMALHKSGDRYFGKSKHGFYTCQKDAMAAGYHMAGTHKHMMKKSTSSSAS